MRYRPGYVVCDLVYHFCKFFKISNYLLGRILGRYSYFPVYSILELRGHDCWRFAPGVRSFSGYVDDTSLVTVNTVFAMATTPVSDTPGACSNLYFRSPIEIFFSEIFLELFFETFFGTLF